MNIHWWDDVSNTLTNNVIINTVCEKGQGIMVNRDSIISNTEGKDENEHYANLIATLKTIHSYRFYYGAKTDDWLLLQMIV